MTAFLHGVEVVEIDDGPRPIRTAASAIIGVIGHAPRGPVNTPVLLTNNRVEAARIFGGAAGFSLPQALDDIWDQAGAVVVAINVCDPAVHRTTVAAANYPVTAGAAQLPNGAIQSATVKVSAGGATLAEGTDYTLDAETGRITLLSTAATTGLTQVNVAFTYTDPTKVLMSDVVGGVDSGTGAYRGVQALLGAKSVVGVTPRILCAPGYTGPAAGGAASPAATELLAVAERLRAIVVIDGPATNDAAALAYRARFGSRRAYIVDPAVLVYSAATDSYVARPASARVAGVIAGVDAAKGFWVSPSNNEIAGIGGTSRPIDFALGDPTCRANVLNAAEVTTIIQQDGFRLWGNRTCSADPKWAFLSVVRTADVIRESLLAAHLWAVDRNITRTYVEQVTESVNAFLRDLQARGAILGGRCWADPAQNSPSKIADGQVTFDFDFTPAYPAERITFRERLTTAYAATLFAA